MKLKSTLIIILVGFIVNPMTGQFYPFSKLVKEADVCYDAQQYVLALKHYNDASKMDGKMHKNSVYRYADAAFHVNSLGLSEELFMQYLENGKVDQEQDALYKLILIRQKQGRYEEAILDCNIYISEFDDEFPETSKEVKFIRSSCQWAVDAQQEALVDSVMSMKNVNSGFSEQAPFLFEDSLYFNSVDHEVLVNKQKTYISKIYKENKQEVEIKGIEDAKFISHPSFTHDGKYFFFTLCDQELDRSFDCDIYFSFVGPDKEIGVARKVLHAVNSDAYSSTHPMVVPQDTSFHLYFASNMPGGKGGFDIYKATLNEEMTLTDLQNLETINTERDEYAPFLNFNTNDLYFSSNGHEGYGGFDIYRLDMDASDEELEAENVGPKLNSPLNDVFYRSNENGSIVYFSSNRPGSMYLEESFESCCYDIYYAEVKECSIDLLALIYDRSNEEMLSNSSLSVIDPETQDTVYSANSEENIYEVELECDKDYIIEVEKQGYDLSSLPFRPTNFSYGQDNEIIRKIYLSPSIYDLDLTVLSKDTNLPLDSLDFILTDLSSGEQQTVVKHPSNNIHFDLIPGTDYKIDVSRRGYRDTTEVFNSGSTVSVINKTIYLEEKEIIKQAKVSLANAIPVALFFDHDAPGPGVEDTLSKLNYTESYESYYDKRGRYVYNYVSNFRGSQKDDARRESSRFFDNEVKAGFEKYDLFKNQLLLVLESGQTVNVYLRGYASPIAKNAYNQALGRRRVDSVRKEFDEWNDGALIPYIQSGQLLVTERSFGEETSPSGVSDDPAYPNQSIFSPSASRERRVEIDEINFNEN